jgi:plastocyanin
MHAEAERTGIRSGRGGVSSDESLPKRSPMIRLTILAAVAAALLLVGSAGAAMHPTLVGVVGKNNAYKITLTFNNKLVKTLKAGTYTVVIHDDSSIHNYELDGPHGKSWKFTTPSFRGTKTFTIKFVAGKYKAYCAPHESVMFQHFTVS